MAQPQFLFRFDMLMELIGAVIGFLIGYYALKGYKASSKRELLLLHFGFVILGVSMLLRVITTAYAVAVIREEEPLRPVIEFARIVYPSIKLVAYTLFAITYTYKGKTASESQTVIAAVPISLLFYNPFLELMATVLLAYVMVHAVINSAIKRSSATTLVSLGFSSMFIGQLFFIFATVSDNSLFFMLGHFVNLMGFLFLLIMLMQVSKAE